MGLPTATGLAAMTHGTREKKGMSSSVPPADSMANNANVNFSQFKSYVVLYTITQCTVDKS